MLLTPLRVAAALLALAAGYMLLPNLAASSLAQDAYEEGAPAPAPIPKGEVSELQAGDCQNGDCLSGDSQTGDCQGGNCGHGHHGHGHGHGRHAMGNPISSRDLFYNYYVGPAAVSNPYGANAVAAMYPSPVPVPPLVGHTYITYQPLLPHEFLYPHKHTYYSQYPGGGQTTTKVHYRTSFFGHVNPRFGNRAPRPRGVEYLENPLWR